MLLCLPNSVTSLLFRKLLTAANYLFLKLLVVGHLYNMSTKQHASALPCLLLSSHLYSDAIPRSLELLNIFTNESREEHHT